MTHGCIIAALIAVRPICLSAQDAQYSEYEVKAALLEKFARFIEWPDHTAAGASDSDKRFVVGVIGENPFGSILETMYVRQTINGRRVEVRYLSSVDEVEGCHILFIAQSESHRISQILRQTFDQPILTVSDYQGYTKKGVLITFFVTNGQIRFEINQQAVRQSGLYVSSLLLNLSKPASEEAK